MVVPILLYAVYGSEVCGYSDNCIKKLEVFHRAVYKRTLKLGKSTPNVMIYGETGTKPLQLQIEKRTIGCWLKLITSKSTKLNFKIYRCFLQLNDRECSINWICKIKQIIQRCGFHYLWRNQNDITTGSKNTIQLMMNTRIDEVYQSILDVPHTHYLNMYDF